MKNSSSNSSVNNGKLSSSYQLPTIYYLLFSLLLTGCESLERKLTRKPKHPLAPPSPIINFQDYTGTMTPLERYRKHYLMFSYWNDDLITSLQDREVNVKRCKRASSEALAELETMKALLVDAVGDQLQPLLVERQRVDQQFQHGPLTTGQATLLFHTLEAQTRQIHRTFFWRDVQDHLNVTPSSARGEDAR